MSKRDPSYRKPVPKYIPSPPPSPPTSPVRSSATPMPTLPLDESPPLPRDWRQVIEKVATPGPSRTDAPPLILSKVLVTKPSLSKVPDPRPASSSSSNTARVTGIPLQQKKLMFHKIEFPTGPVDDIECHGELFGPMPGSSTRSPSVSNRRQKRRLHQYYRPPTPPLRAERKAGRQKVDSVNVERDNNKRTIDNIYALKVIGPLSVRTTSSFRTDSQTLVSLDNPNSSTVWSGGLTAFASLSDASTRGYPVLPMHIKDVIMPQKGTVETDGSCDTRPNLSLWDRVGQWKTSLVATILAIGAVFCSSSEN